MQKRYDYEIDSLDLDDELNAPKSDKLLFAGLIGLNTVSGLTTIQGALQILTGPAGLVAGVAIQSMLLLLSSDKAASHAPLRKWTAMAVLSSVSIYTSFFSYYGLMTKDKQAKTASSMAISAFTTQKAAIYSPIATKVSQLEGNIKQLETQRVNEIKGDGTTGIQGVGDQAVTLAKELEKKRKEYHPLQAVHEKIKSDFDFDLTNLTPEDLFKKAQVAYSNIPPEFRGNAKPPKRDDFIDIDSSVEFLAPVNKLKRGDTDAFASLAIASFVDGMIILLATAVTIKKRNSKAPIQDLTKWIAQNLIDIKVLIRTIVDISDQVVGGMPSADFIDTTRLDNPVHLVSFRLRGRASHFLAMLYHHLHPETRVLDYEALLKHDNPTYQLGYRMMLDELRRLRWIVWNRKDRNFVASSQSCYMAFTAWLNSEMVRQAKEEARLETEGVVVNEDLERGIILRFPKA
jgi:hypothetical protein